MDKKIKQKWIAALRSGEYKQAHGKLRDGDSFCCLGVLCNLHAQAHPRVAATQGNPRLYMGHDSFLPRTVQKWAKLPDILGASVVIDSQHGVLTEHNDGIGGCKAKTFAQIADAIESQL